MPINDAQQIGRLIGNIINNQDELQQNINADETEPQDIVPVSNSLALQGTAIISSSTYPTDSFILDHPVYCDLDSSVLKLDGGYDPSATGVELERQIF